MARRGEPGNVAEAMSVLKHQLSQTTVIRTTIPVLYEL